MQDTKEPKLVKSGNIKDYLHIKPKASNKHCHCGGSDCGKECLGNCEDCESSKDCDRCPNN